MARRTDLARRSPLRAAIAALRATTLCASESIAYLALDSLAMQGQTYSRSPTTSAPQAEFRINRRKTKVYIPRRIADQGSETMRRSKDHKENQILLNDSCACMDSPSPAVFARCARRLPRLSFVAISGVCLSRLLSSRHP